MRHEYVNGEVAGVRRCKRKVLASNPSRRTFISLTYDALFRKKVAQRKVTNHGRPLLKSIAEAASGLMLISREGK